MTSRTIGTSFRRELERQTSAEGILAFITITHDDIADPIRVVSDTVEYVYDTYTWQYWWFDMVLLTDGDRPPRTELTLQNVDKRIGDAIKQLLTPPKFKIEILPLSDFDLTVDPRVARGTPVVAYEADELYLLDVEVTDLFIKGTIQSWDYTQEIYPSVRATQARCPGLFR